MSASILLVDDELRVTQGLKRRLRRHGYQVLTAESGREALELLQDNEVDVLLSDERMPGMSGSELLAIVSRDYPKTIRMILSGQATLDAAIRAINEGQIHKFFLKPCQEDDLLFSITQLLELRALGEENQRLRAEVDAKQAALERLESELPGISELEEDEDGALVIDGRDV